MRWIITIAALVALAGAIWALSRDLLPPKEVRFASGGQGGGYWSIAERYARILAEDGISVRVLETSGSVDNARLLAEGEADVALIQGGIALSGAVKSLGALFVEPMFLFIRTDGPVPQNPALWRGVRVARGGAGSGTAAAFQGFRTAAGLGEQAVTEVEAGGADGAAALRAGEVDVAVFVAPLSAPYLEDLFSDPGISLLRIEHATALSRRMAQTEVVVLPSGGVTLAPAVPVTDLPMLGMVANLVARDDLHPSLADRLVEAARSLHSTPSAISPEGRFPSPETSPVPVDPYAAKLIREGTSPLQAYLPYWVVAQINRFALLLVPVLIFLIPLARAIPGLYAWRMRRRVFLHYAEIREIDDAARTEKDPGALRALIERLDATDQAIAGLSLPPTYRDRAYSARLHIDLVRQKIQSRQAALRADAGAELDARIVQPGAG